MVNSILAKFQIAKQLPTFEQELHQIETTHPKVYTLGLQLIERYMKHLYIRRAAAILALPGLAVSYWTQNILPVATMITIWGIAMMMCLLTATSINQLKDQYHLTTPPQD